MLRNGETVIGLFQGMFKQNMLTFNPGWNQNCATLEDFIDVREIQSKLAANGIELTSTADETATGPGSCTLTDPDGNPILLDQHV